jgi:hypothetical protein
VLNKAQQDVNAAGGIVKELTTHTAGAVLQPGNGQEVKVKVAPYRFQKYGMADGVYRWTSYRANALGQTDSRLTPPPLYLALGDTGKERQAAYRALFRTHLDQEAIDDIRHPESAAGRRAVSAADREDDWDST